MKRILILWLPVVLASALVCGLIYFSGQYVLRMSANDPQIQIAEDAVHLLETGATPSMIQTDKIIIEQSLAPFIIFYTADGKPIQSNAHLGGAVPTPPQGVFAYTKDHDEDRITWEPQRGVRIAAVIRKVDSATGGFVLAGRSLREVEKREMQLAIAVIATWLIILLVTLVQTIIIVKAFTRKS